MPILPNNISHICPVRILIACDSLLLSGGMLRFERVGTILKNWGHEVYTVSLSGDRGRYNSSLPSISLQEALVMQWDAVMIPGAGFPDETIEKFSILRNANFGVRVQHILNDQSRRERFMAVNRSFSPQIIIFNNEHWPVGSFTNFFADRFHVLLGAVDSSFFSPVPYRKHSLCPERWVVGGLANKNPQPLIEALYLLPSNITLRLYGLDPFGLAERYTSLISEKRLEILGPLLGDQALYDFYQRVDCVAMTETFAGWANLAAESMACGIPVVCTAHGTTAFAFDNETALLVDPTPESLSKALTRLRTDFSLCTNLAINARRVISKYTWEKYAQLLLKLIKHDGMQHYTYAPEDGLYGKWPFSERLLGLESLFGWAANSSVLDFGAAEGLIAREIMLKGATKIRGFELNADRVNKANALCSQLGDAKFFAADLSDWEAFYSKNRENIESSDIVLYLGIHHHLPQNNRQKTLCSAADLALKIFAIRTPEIFYETDEIEKHLTKKGFVRFQDLEYKTEKIVNLGAARIYIRP